MLVLTRKMNERIIIGDEVEITVLQVGQKNVRLGIKAPKHIQISKDPNPQPLSRFEKLTQSQTGFGKPSEKTSE